MALLNKNEICIQTGMRKEDPFLSEVCRAFISFFKTIDDVERTDHCVIINYLYYKEHSGETFVAIAQKLHIGDSTLERNRKKYTNYFIYFMEKLKTGGEFSDEAAITYDKN